MIHRLAVLALALSTLGPAAAQAQSASVVLDADPHARYKFSGVVGERVAANSTGWLTRMPAADPGLLAMFRLRDRQPRPNLVPWAGEFVGKYLISAIEAIRMDNDPRLFATVKSVVTELIASQADDGYLGPFPQEERLLKYWDLWGHYHVMLALMMWHEQTGDAAALEACRKAADLVCRIYLDTERRPRDAGSTEMNLAIIHALGRLYRLTQQERYLRMMREIEKDWELEGDYFRTGLAGVEFYRTPKPRWESLHDLQGLVELYLITGDQRYRTAFLNLWNSIRRLDRRNTGGFSSGEQATGTPYEPTAIETCCTIAWMALTVDALRLTGDPLAADELERSTYNGVLGAQHPSGCWWTYNTPMNGVREASHHTIVFQARAGTPDLNCCSVNAPRALGMLTEWAMMRSQDGLAVNYYGPMEARVPLEDGTTVAMRQETLYPLDGRVKLEIQLKEPHEFTLQLRIPGWSSGTDVVVTSRTSGSPAIGAAVEDVPAAKSTVPRANESSARPGTYHTIRRLWKSGDVVELNFDMALRYESGGGEMAGRMSVFRGPLLLAYDVLLNDNSPAEPPVLTPSDLKNARLSLPARAAQGTRIGQFAPWVVVDVPLRDAPPIRLCDFATAGAGGSYYASWLPARDIAPPPPAQDYPDNGAAIPAGRMLFRTRRIAAQVEPHSMRLVIAETPDFRESRIVVEAKDGRRIIVPEDQTSKLQANKDYFWKLVASNQWGTAESPAPGRSFTVDPSLPPLSDDMLTEYGENAQGLVIEADLQGDPKPSYGTLALSQGWKSASGLGDQPGQAIQLDGQNGMLVYTLRAFPETEYTVSIWCSPGRTEGSLGQIFSAWCRGMDDPLRICVQQGKLFARIEAGALYATGGIPIEQDKWYHISVVKKAGELTLYLDGNAAETISVPLEIHSAARDFALGGNPHFTGSSEHLTCRVAQLALYARAFGPDEIAAIYDAQRPK